ncbi:MAG: 4-hydroxythreonine-4-phosphate dehydrogenase PdxA [Fusicatenibacter sp.]|nr:4-hydroxythreonine-4-phosphate dehydrogenase PdxA [Fusicatenibacter sp.]
METGKKKRVVIPIGDPAGIGPEIAVKALAHPELHDWCEPILTGEKSVLEQALTITGLPLQLHAIGHAQEGIYHCGVIDYRNLDNVRSGELVFGEIQAKAGRAAYEFIEEAVRLLKTGQADAIATTSIQKEALKAAGVPYIGHTEILADLLETKDPMTMFQVRNLKVFFLTRHLSLKDALEQVKEERIYQFILRCHGVLKKLGIQNPRIAVAGLNPHSGEHGLFGMEEVKEIAPAVERAREQGICAYEPVPADSVFYQALMGKYDAVMSLYHDQGHIATKMVDFERTIAVTLGMPYIRTSVDHGTAFDIAGKNLASEVSMCEAIRLAAEYAEIYRVK